MKNLMSAASILAISLTAATVHAETTKDCMLEGTVYKSEQGGEEQTKVKFHSAKKYDTDSNCRVRKGEKMEFKLPEDTRLQEAPSGSQVKYRYQQDKDGSSKTELVSVGA